MAFNDRKITDTQINTEGITGAPDKLTGTAAQNKARFDQFIKNILKSVFNGLIDDLQDEDAAAEIGAEARALGDAETVQGQLDADYEALGDKVDKVDGKALSTNDYSDEEKAKVTSAAAKEHEHANKTLLDAYDQTNTNLSDAVSKKHNHSNKNLLDTYTQTEANLNDAVDKKHGHGNKALLDTYTQTEVNLADAVTKKHSHSNSSVLNAITSTVKNGYDALVTMFSGISSVVTSLGNDNTTIPTSKAVKDAISSSGGGDMLKSVYDQDDDGIVDDAKDSIKLGGHSSSYFQQATSGLATENAIADADTIPYYDSSASASRKTAWSNIKAKLKTYFDGLYQALLVSGTNIKTINGSSVLGSGNLELSAQCSNRNLVDNPWFTVNQRGLNTYSLAYCVDRWKLDGGTRIDVNDNGVSIVSVSSTNYAFLTQVMEWQYIAGKTVTLSIMMTDGTIKSGVANIPSEIPSESTQFYINITVNEQWECVLFRRTTGYFGIQIRSTVNSADELDVRAVKLELGSVSTLALDIAPNYAEELAKCQRYFWKAGPNKANVVLGLGVAQAGANVNGFSALPVPLRFDPTVEFNNLVLYDGQNIINVTSCVVSRQSNGVLQWVFGAADLTVGKAYNLVLIAADSYLSLSTDL